MDKTKGLAELRGRFRGRLGAWLRGSYFQGISQHGSDVTSATARRFLRAAPFVFECPLEAAPPVGRSLGVGGVTSHMASRFLYPQAIALSSQHQPRVPGRVPGWDRTLQITGRFTLWCSGPSLN